jgi:CBS-domain-containing membrane protein
MSPRAACRLETLGFEQVYDYVAGKADWLARGLPREGEKAVERRALDLVRDDAVVCGLNEKVGDVRRRIDASPYRFAFVVAPGGTLLGRLRRTALEIDPDALAETVMEAGPSTVRPDKPLDQLLARMEKADVQTAVLTTPGGMLLGIVLRRDVEAALSEP